MDRQEAAFTAWLNATLAPPDLSGASSVLHQRRLGARITTLLWTLYQQDAELQEAMVKVEARINGGFLGVQPEVRGRARGRSLQRERVCELDLGA